MDKNTVPFAAFEAQLTRSEINVRRMFIALICAILALVASNIAWLVYLSGYDFSGSETVVEAEDGVANYIGNDGEISNGAYYGAETQSNP